MPLLSTYQLAHFQESKYPALKALNSTAEADREREMAAMQHRLKQYRKSRKSKPAYVAPQPTEPPAPEPQPTKDEWRIHYVSKTRRWTCRKGDRAVGDFTSDEIDRAVALCDLLNAQDLIPRVESTSPANEPIKYRQVG